MVRLFSSMHNPASKKYTFYHSMVLLTVTGVVIFMTFQVIHQGMLQGSLTFFEGFMSLFMLSRNEKVGKSFLSHVSGISEFTRSHLSFL
ncbi:MAG TPA: hypothetical protein VJ771_05810 [Candidatus Nitrosotalea sp.]|nr:hypothetical protein [Candidatus Nitrosotalea sp.]